MNTRRQFLIRAPLGFLVGAASAAMVAAADRDGQPPTTPGAPPTFGSGPGVRAGGHAGDVRRSREARAGHDDAGRARSRRPPRGGRRWRRTSNGAPARGRVALDPTDAPAHALESDAAGNTGASRRATDSSARTAEPGPLPASDDEIAFAPVTRAVAVDRIAAAHVGASDEHLSRPHRAVRRSAARRHHADARSRDRARQAGRRGDRRGQVPRAAARHSVRREGPARHEGHSDHLRRRAVPQPRAGLRTRRSSAGSTTPGAVLIAKLSLGALALNDIWFGGQTMNPWLLEEGASGSSAGPGAATAAALVGVLGRQRNRRQHRRASDALRCDRLPADVRTRGAHRRDDALLVARQARAR